MIKIASSQVKPRGFSVNWLCLGNDDMIKKVTGIFHSQSLCDFCKILVNHMRNMGTLRLRGPGVMNLREAARF